MACRLPNPTTSILHGTNLASLADESTSPTGADEIIPDVGGRTFKTTIGTLTGKSGYFQGVLSGRWPIKKNAEGISVYFLDQDGDVFVHILDYLRNERMLFFCKEGEGFDRTLYSRVLVQAQYLIIQPLVKWIEQSRFETVIETTTSFVVHAGDLGSQKALTTSGAERVTLTEHVWGTRRMHRCPRESHSCRNDEVSCQRRHGNDPKSPVTYFDVATCKMLITKISTKPNWTALESCG